MTSPFSVPDSGLRYGPRLTWDRDLQYQTATDPGLQYQAATDQGLQYQPTRQTQGLQYQTTRQTQALHQTASDPALAWELVQPRPGGRKPPGRTCLWA